MRLDVSVVVVIVGSVLLAHELLRGNVDLG